LGVAPLALATGAGAEMRRSLGAAVLFGMLGVTCFGLLFTPTFYAVVRQLSGNGSSQKGRIDAPARSFERTGQGY
jgi:Cu/Ag efflux pump CusA